MHKIKYKEMSINRPLVVARGFPGQIEANGMQAYFGEWVVFKLPMNEEETVFGELRMPIEEALEQGLVIASDRIYSHEEEDEEFE